MPTDKRVKIEVKTNIPSTTETPIFDQLAEEFTQFYADHVLARKVEADLNGKEEVSNDTNGRNDTRGTSDAGGGVCAEGGAASVEACEQE